MKAFSRCKSVLSLLYALACCSSGFGQEDSHHVMPENFFYTGDRTHGGRELANEDLAPDVWEPMGPNGITANAIAADPRNSNVIFTAGLSGLYKTSDGGIFWEIASEQLLNKYIVDLSIHPASSNILLAWVRSNFGPLSLELMRSTDNGTTWITLLERRNTQAGILFDPMNSNRVFAYADSVYRSSDGGVTWKGMVASVSAVNALAIYHQNPEILYALTGSRTIYKSSDGGQSWVVQSFSLPTFRRAEFALLVSPMDPNILFLGNSSFTGTGGFYRSVDGGITWIQSTTGFGQSKSVNVIGVDPLNPDILYAGGNATGLYRSTNTGDTWTFVSGAVPDRYVYYLISHPDGHIYCAFGGNIYSSIDQGATWQSLNGNLQNVDVFDVVPHPGNADIIYANSLGGVYRSMDGGITWQPSNSGLIDNDVFGLAMDPNNTNILYAGTFGGLIYKTTNGGNTWVEKSNGLPGLGEASGSTSKISIHPRNSSWVWTGRFRAYHSFNGGENWAPFVIEGRRANEVVYDPARPDTMYATANDTLFRTTDRGLTWAVRRTGLRLGSPVVDPLTPNTLYADSLGRAIIKSTNGGLTWSRLEATSFTTRGITINPDNSALIYAASFGNGVRRSTDAGLSWSNYNTGQPYLSTFFVRTATGRPHTLFVATFGGSIYRVDETETSVAEEAPIVAEFALQQNYPNPFNPITKIQYTISQSGHVLLKIYNLAGQEVITLVNGRKPVGEYEVQWRPEGLPSGVYVYRLQTGDFVTSKKLVLLK